MLCIYGFYIPILIFHAKLLLNREIYYIVGDKLDEKIFDKAFRKK